MYIFVLIYSYIELYYGGGSVKEMDERVREIKKRYGNLDKKYTASQYRRKKEEETVQGQGIIFQIYVTAVIVIVVFIVSVINTDRTQQIKGRLQSELSYQMTLDSLKELSNEAISVLKSKDTIFSNLKQEQKTQQEAQQKEYVPKEEKETKNESSNVYIENGAEADELKNNQAPLIN